MSKSEGGKRKERAKEIPWPELNFIRLNETDCGKNVYSVTEF